MNKSTHASRCTDPRVLKGRPVHELNDKLVTLRAGAQAGPMYSGGASLIGGHDHQGYVWAVADGVAVVADLELAS